MKLLMRHVGLGTAERGRIVLGDRHIPLLRLTDRRHYINRASPSRGLPFGDVPLSLHFQARCQP